MAIEDLTIPPLCKECNTLTLVYIAPNSEAWQIQWIIASEPYDVGLVRNTRARHNKKDCLYCKNCKKYFSFEELAKKEQGE